jgi:hypothetical protein
MDKCIELTESFKFNYQERFGGQIITIPFESFVLNPWPYMEQIEKMLGSNITSKTKKVLKKQRVPRNKIADGLPLEIYKRCGWEPPERSLTEKEELEKRRQFAIENGASKKSMAVLDNLSEKYETTYFTFENKKS